jgi:hypothetical protein
MSRRRFRAYPRARIGRTTISPSGVTLRWSGWLRWLSVFLPWRQR